MENRVSDKIRRLLNEIAILNQPEEKNGKLFYRLEDLRQLRVLGAELYLLCDLAAKTGEVFHPEVKQELEIPVFEEPEQAAKTQEAEVNIPEPPVELPEAPLAEPAVEIPVVRDEPEQVIVTPEPEPAEEIISEANLNSHEPSEKLQEEHHHHKPRKTAEQLAAGLSLTRRFEYINNLFGGNAELFMEFLDEVGYSENSSAAMDVFDKHYEHNNWRRREETADDLRRMIRKSYLS